MDVYPLCNLAGFDKVDVYSGWYHNSENNCNFKVSKTVDDSQFLLYS